MFVYIWVYRGMTIDKVFSPMIRPASVEDDAYEPYAAQALPITRSLPGIPVSKDGNYTDENGQQWICDEVDFERGVYVQRVSNAALDGSNDEYWYTIRATGGTIFGYAIADALPAGSCKNLYCTHFIPSVTDAYNKTGDACYFYEKTLRVCHTGIDTLDEFKMWLSENPISVTYLLGAPIETPLTSEELEAYASLRSNYPNTSVLNDGGAGMAVKYVADTKLYIDKKLTI